MSVSVRDGGHIKGCGSHVRGFSLTNTCTFYGLTSIVKPTTCLSFCVLFYSVFYSVLLLPMLFSFIICALPSHSSPFSLFFSFAHLYSKLLLVALHAGVPNPFCSFIHVFIIAIVEVCSIH
ncbi:hypothetical protein DPX39_090080800 [Trypanosoma brucei equiperdum]|uniref:Uncharacterized protein n=1 Tax=Trypanosoma brucei equiperdum TaxID=630700 RepID=A0A3L6L356_9TRYP|nr:hypothetical protein DPX39_090080800 [Trypanosoma brucei equiperdum]